MSNKKNVRKNLTEIESFIRNKKDGTDEFKSLAAAAISSLELQPESDLVTIEQMYGDEHGNRYTITYINGNDGGILKERIHVEAHDQFATHLGAIVVVKK